MDTKTFSVSLKNNPSVSVKVLSGHFTTSSAHVSHFIDVGSLKSNAVAAREAAREMAAPYAYNTLIETIVCMERTEVIGAYLAEELMQKGMSSVVDNEIYIVTPINNNLGSLSFQSSTIKCVMNKNVLLLVTSVSSGHTLNGAIDCITYYGGRLAGISCLFLALADTQGQTISSLFNSDDIPGYVKYGSRNCGMCQAGQKLDALISSEGYTKL